MPSVEMASRDPSSPIKSPSRKSKDKHDSKKQKRDVANEQAAADADFETDVRKRKREIKEKKKEIKEKAKEKGKKRNKKKKEIDVGEQTPTEEKNSNKKLKERLQSMVIHDIESLVTGPLSSNNCEGTPRAKNPAASPTTPPSPLKSILKSPDKRMDSSKPPLETVNSNAGKANGPSQLPAYSSALSKPSRPRKSVKFDSEAAAADGESRQRIHNALIAAYKAEEAAAEAAAVTPEELANSVDTNAPPTKKQKREKRRKEKKEQVKKNGKDENAKQSALSYMLEYHKNRETWKFQKAKQNWILRNAFDVAEIEATKENSTALKAYIAGLQGQEARNRLLLEAKKILNSGEDDAKKDSGGNVDTDEEKEKKIERAKEVMIGLGHEDDDDEEDTAEEDCKHGGVSLKDSKDYGGDDSEDEDGGDEDSDDSEDE